MWGVGRAAYALLEADDLLVGQGVRLGDDGIRLTLVCRRPIIDLLEPVEVKGQYTRLNAEKV